MDWCLTRRSGDSCDAAPLRQDALGGFSEIAASHGHRDSCFSFWRPKTTFKFLARRPSHLLLFPVVDFPLSPSTPTISSRFTLVRPHPLTPLAFSCPPPPLSFITSPAAPLRWWSPIEHRLTQSFGQCSNCVFSLCGPHREGIDHRLMRDVGRRTVGVESRREAGRSKKRLLYMSSNPPPPPPPPLLNALNAIIPESQLHYSPHSIDLKSDLSISYTHTHTQTRGCVWSTWSNAALWKKLMNPWSKAVEPTSESKRSLNVLLIFSIIDRRDSNVIGYLSRMFNWMTGRAGVRVLIDIRVTLLRNVLLVSRNKNHSV